MTTIKRPHFEAGVRRDERWRAYELRWPRHDYEILLEPRGGANTTWKHRPRRFVPTLELVPSRVGGPSRLHTMVWPESASWPAGGVFVPTGRATPAGREPKPRDWYNPVEVARDILLDVQRTAGDDPKSLLDFVNKWGALGVGIPGYENFSFDGVLLTGRALTWFKKWIEAFHALKGGKETTATWDSLALFLSGTLTRIHPDARPTERGLDPVYRLSTLKDALCLELWEMATEGKRLRRCPECRALFIPGRANQEYCTHLCANRPTVRRARRKAKRKARMAQSKQEG